MGINILLAGISGLKVGEEATLFWRRVDAMDLVNFVSKSSLSSLAYAAPFGTDWLTEWALPGINHRHHGVADTQPPCAFAENPYRMFPSMLTALTLSSSSPPWLACLPATCPPLTCCCIMYAVTAEAAPATMIIVTFAHWAASASMVLYWSATSLRSSPHTHLDNWLPLPFIPRYLGLIPGIWYHREDRAYCHYRK